MSNNKYKLLTKDLCQICGEPVKEVYVLLDGEGSNGMKSGHKRCLKKYENLLKGEPLPMDLEDLELFDNLVNIPITITDISLNQFEEVVVYNSQSCYRLSEEFMIASFIDDLQASRAGIANFRLVSGTIYNNDNILKIDIKGKSIKVWGII